MKHPRLSCCWFVRSVSWVLVKYYWLSCQWGGCVRVDAAGEWDFGYANSTAVGRVGIDHPKSVFKERHDLNTLFGWFRGWGGGCWLTYLVQKRNPKRNDHPIWACKEGEVKEGVGIRVCDTMEKVHRFILTHGHYACLSEYVRTYTYPPGPNFAHKPTPHHAQQGLRDMHPSVHLSMYRWTYWCGGTSFWKFASVITMVEHIWKQTLFLNLFDCVRACMHRAAERGCR